MANRQAEEKITALYERLSRDDDLTGDSNSILEPETLSRKLCSTAGLHQYRPLHRRWVVRRQL